MMWAVDDANTDVLSLGYAYFETPEPWDEEEPGTYVETDVEFEHNRAISWNHGLGETVTALLSRGFELTGLVEHRSVPWDALPGRMVQDGDLDEWRLAEHADRLPLSYTLQARKPLGPRCRRAGQAVEEAGGVDDDPLDRPRASSRPSPSCAWTARTTRRPSTAVTLALATTSDPMALAARCSTCTRVPTLVSPAARAAGGRRRWPPRTTRRAGAWPARGGRPTRGPAPCPRRRRRARPVRELLTRRPPAHRTAGADRPTGRRGPEPGTDAPPAGLPWETPRERSRRNPWDEHAERARSLPPLPTAAVGSRRPGRPWARPGGASSRPRPPSRGASSGGRSTTPPTTTASTARGAGSRTSSSSSATARQPGWAPTRPTRPSAPSWRPVSRR